MKKIKYLVRKLANILKFDIYPLDKRNSIQAYLEYLFCNGYVDEIWDVGANVGQYGRMLRNIGFKGSILSFEPIPAAWEELAKSAHRDNNWEIFECCALGSISGLQNLNVTNDSVSSSLLVPNDKNTISAGLTVEVKRLDQVIHSRRLGNKTLLKLDCQGGEYEIIESAGNYLQKFKYIQMELSIYPMYECEKDFISTINLMSKLNYEICFIYPGIIDSKGRMAQIEVIFMNAEKY